MPPNEGQGLILARFLFNSREQEQSESVDDYAGSLTKLSSKCKYEAAPAFVENLVRDRFIVGIRNKEVQSKLLKCANDLSLDCAIEIVKSSGKDIKLENDEEDMPISLHDKLQVQVDVLPAKPDIKVSEEAKIAILIELMNHKSILNAPSGHEEEKAELWEKVFHFAKTTGAPFKSALHLREVFGTWKSSAIQSKQPLSQDDVKMSNADKLIWDMFGQDTFEDYPNLQSILNDSANVLDFDDDRNHDDELYNFDENDLNSSSSGEEASDDDEYEPVVKRRPGRPRKGSPSRGPSIVMSAELKVMVLKRLLQQKDVITAQGNEREKKNVWRNLFHSLENKLNVGSPSVLRNAFRLWKQRSLKKRSQPGETITESDKLIYKIFNMAETETADLAEQAASEGQDEETRDEEPSEEDDEDAGKSFIDHSLRLKILHELAKHRRKIVMNVGTVYEIEASWRDIHEKVQSDLGLKHLTMKKVKELLQFWQSWALHAAVRQGGPVTKVQKLTYFANNIPKNAAAPYASMKDGVPPVLISRVPGCIHITPQARTAILKGLISSKSDPDKWKKATNIALEHNIEGATEAKLRFAVKQWKAKTIEKYTKGSKPRTKTEKLSFELCDLNDDIALDKDWDDQVPEITLSEEVRMAIVTKVAENPFILSRKAKEAARKRFWTEALESSFNMEIDVKALKASFWHWSNITSSNAGQRLSKILDALGNIHTINRQMSDDIKASVVNQVFQNQQILLLGTNDEKSLFWNQLLKLLGKAELQDGMHLSMLFTLWKEAVLIRIEKGISLKPFEHMILQVCIGHLSNFDLSQSAKASILPWLRGNQWKKNWMEIHSKTVGQHGIQDPMTFFKAVKRWKLNALKKEEFGHPLNEEELQLLQTVDVEDWLEADLMARSEDTSRYDASAKTVVPNAVKSDIVTLISTKQDSVYGSNIREMNNFWTETLDSFMVQRNVCCHEAADLQRAYFAWTFEAWQKKLSNAYLLPYEEVMLELISSKNRIEQFNWDEENHEEVEQLDVSEKDMSKLINFLIEYKDLQSRDKCLFWTLGLRFVQSYCNCDNSPARLYATILKERVSSQQSSFRDVPLTELQRSILVLFGNASIDDNASSVEDDDEGDDVCEEENFWDKLTDEVSDKARMAILQVLYEHRDIVASRKMQRRDHDRTAVWQKALNVAIEEGVKIENHGKLTRMVTDWREKAKRHEIDGRPLSSWERYLLSIFEDENNIKEELEDNDDEFQTSAASEPIYVEEAVKLVIMKALLRHRQLFLGNSDQQDSGWRKVFRIAQANGAFYDTVTSMQSSIDKWKTMALAKLSKYPTSISEVDKLLYSFYEVDVGQLDLDQIHYQQDSPLKMEIPTATGLTVRGKMAILEEMHRNKASIIDNDNWPSHKDRFSAWSNVLQVANCMGGNFPSIASLTTYVWHQLKSPTLQKIQAGSAINEIDSMVAKIYDLDEERLEFSTEYDLSIPTQHGCRLCQLQFSRFDEMKLHQQMAHGQLPEEDISRKCRLCGSDVGLDKPAIRAHFRSHHSEEPFQCDFCDQMYLNDADYYEHAKTHLTYNPMETIEAMLENTEESNQSSPPATIPKQQRKRGIYRKRVKIELPPPESEEVPKIGKKEGGLCPHCGEVSPSYFNPNATTYNLLFFSTTSTFSSTSCTSTKPKSHGNAISAIMLTHCRKASRNMCATAIQKRVISKCAIFADTRLL